MSANALLHLLRRPASGRMKRGVSRDRIESVVDDGRGMTQHRRAKNVCTWV